MWATIIGKSGRANKSKKSSRERKNSTSRRHHNLSKQGHATSFTNLKNPHEDKIKNIMALLQNSGNAIKMSNYNENIFKAIQSKIMNDKSGVKSFRENITPKSIKKNSGVFSNRTGSFKTAFATNTYNSTFSPRSLKSGRKDRHSIWSPISMKAIGGHKKSTSRAKHSHSKKRDSLGRNQSRHAEEMTIFGTTNKPCFTQYNDKLIKKKRSSCKKKKKSQRELLDRPQFITNQSANTSSIRNPQRQSHKRSSSRVAEIYTSSASKAKSKPKRTSTLTTGNFLATENLSFQPKHKERAIFKILNHKLGKKIVPTIPAHSSKCSTARALFSVPGSQEQLSSAPLPYYPTSSGNRAHLIATQREYLHPQPDSK